MLRFVSGPLRSLLKGPSYCNISLLSTGGRSMSSGNPPGSGSSSSGTGPILRHSVFGGEYHQENIKAIADFLFEYAVDPRIEIEGKIGQIITQDTDLRMKWPLRSAVVLADDRIFRFESSVVADQFELLKEKLQALPDVKIKETRQRDRAHNNGVRVQQDDMAGTETAIRKRRIANLNVHEPECDWDFRISASSEVPVKFPVDPPKYERRKHRLSFTVGSHPWVQFDLTRVESTVRIPHEITYEIEIEITDVPRIIAERQKAIRHEDNQIMVFAQSLWNQLSALCHILTAPANKAKRQKTH